MLAKLPAELLDMILAYFHPKDIELLLKFFCQHHQQCAREDVVHISQRLGIEGGLDQNLHFWEQDVNDIIKKALKMDPLAPYLEQVVVALNYGETKSVIQQLDKSLWINNRAAIVIFVKAKAYILKLVHPRYCNDIEIVMNALQSSGTNLRYVSPLLCNDKHVVKIAIQENPFALQWASDTLKNDKDIVRRAVRVNGAVLGMASSEMRDHFDVVCEAVGRSGIALVKASRRLQADSRVVEIAVRCYAGALCYASKQLQDNDDIVRIAVAQNRTDALRHASTRLWIEYQVGFVDNKYRPRTYCLFQQPRPLQGSIH